MPTLVESPVTQANPIAIAEALAGEFARTAAERDAVGGTAKEERDLLRQSGLLNLLIPNNDGADWREIFKIVRLFARADSSLAHLFGFQHLMLATIDLFGSEEQRAYYYQETLRQNWFWGNALNPLDTKTSLTREGDRWLLNGRKGFSSGSVDADALIISGVRASDSKLVVAAVPLPRKGLIVRGDWDNMGQRQTDSGTVEFHGVEIADDEILQSPGPLASVRASLRPCIAQLIFGNVFLGIAEGALEAARSYTQKETRPWLTSQSTSAVEDPYILHHYGEILVQIESAKLAADRAGESIQHSWTLGESITPEQRGRTALHVAVAKVLSTRASLDVTSRIFDVMGSRATTASRKLDRFWRNARTQTLHDPVDYKLKELGDWALNGDLPKPSFYS